MIIQPFFVFDVNKCVNKWTALEQTIMCVQSLSPLSTQSRFNWQHMDVAI